MYDTLSQKIQKFKPSLRESYRNQSQNHYRKSKPNYFANPVCIIYTQTYICIHKYITPTVLRTNKSKEIDSAALPADCGTQLQKILIPLFPYIFSKKKKIVHYPILYT